MQKSEVIENRDNQSIIYTFKSGDAFFMTGYKVLKTQEKSGFVSCNRVLHNGKDKLIYDIAGYKSLDMLMPSLNANVFKLILNNLADVIFEIKNNGFMQCENISTDFEDIFVDSNTYKVYMIYLPINVQVSPDSIIVFENKIRTNLISAIAANSNIRDREIENIGEQLKASNESIEMILKFAAGSAPKRTAQSSDSEETGEFSKTESWLGRGVKPSKVKKEKPPKAEKAPKVKKEKPEKEKRFGKKLPDEPGNSSRLPVYAADDEDNATTFLGSTFTKNIAFCGLQTPEKVEFVISKPEFSIGKKSDLVDGAITFNSAISRIHCKIIKENGKHYIVDLGSANGTFVNGEKAAQNAKIEINPGDKVKLANSSFLIKSV